MPNQLTTQIEPKGQSSARAILARICFYGAVVVTLALALLPVSLPGFILSDKVEHFVGFFVLTFLGVWAFGRPRLLILALALIAFGGIIELLQAIPSVGRDAELSDWVADAMGVLLALTIVGCSSVLQPRESEA